MLLTLPNILTPDEIKGVTKLLASAPWTDGRASAGEQAALVKNNQQLPHDCEAAQQIRAMVLRGLDRSSTFFSAALPKRVFTPRINRYGGDTNYYGLFGGGAPGFCFLLRGRVATGQGSMTYYDGRVRR